MMTFTLIVLVVVFTLGLCACWYGLDHEPWLALAGVLLCIGAAVLYVVTQLRVGVPLLVLCVVASASGQSLTLTNADLGKHRYIAKPAGPDVYAALQAHAYHTPVSYPGPVSVTIGSATANAGPWTWPVPPPARRLDGTLLDGPITVYGPLCCERRHKISKHF